MKNVLAELSDREELMLEVAANSFARFEEGYHLGYAHGLREARAKIELGVSDDASG